MQERREREKREQRQRILDAALNIITAHGFAALSMRKLAEKIEYSAASIYLYFENREQIAQELGQMAFGKLLAALEEAATAPDAVEALHAMGEAYVRYGLENPQLYRLIFMSDSDFMTAAFGNQKEPGIGMRAYGSLIELAKRLQSAGIFTHAPMVEVADLIWMMLHGIVSLQITCVGLKLAPAEKLVRLATQTLAGLPAPLREKPKTEPVRVRGNGSKATKRRSPSIS